MASGSWMKVLHGGIEQSTVGATAALLYASEIQLSRRLSETGAVVPFVNGQPQNCDVSYARDPASWRDRSRASSDTPTEVNSILDTSCGPYYEKTHPVRTTTNQEAATDGNFSPSVSNSSSYNLFSNNKLGQGERISTRSRDTKSVPPYAALASNAPVSKSSILGSSVRACSPTGDLFDEPFRTTTAPRKSRRRHKGRRKKSHQKKILRAHHLFDALSVSDTIPGPADFPSASLLDAVYTTGPPPQPLSPSSWSGSCTSDLLLCDEPLSPSASASMMLLMATATATACREPTSTVESLVGLYIGGDLIT
jgi:hypothetical protein